jgi:hypothetical protein
MSTGMVATREAPNRCCQSTVYWPMNESSRTVSGMDELLVVRVSRKNSAHRGE